MELGFVTGRMKEKFSDYHHYDDFLCFHIHVSNAGNYYSIRGAVKEMHRANKRRSNVYLGCGEVMSELSVPTRNLYRL